MLNRYGRFAGAVGLAIALTAPFAGCSKSTSGEPVATGASASSASFTATKSSNPACAAPSTQILNLPTQKPGEPVIGVPQPSGWTRNTSQDSDVVRGAIVNTKLVSGGFAANAVITMENATGVSAQEALQQQVDSLTNGLKITGLKPVPGTLCGYPTTTVSYDYPDGRPNHKATTLAVSVPDGATLWSITVSVQSTVPDDATFQRDAKAILTGLQITK